MGVRPNGPDPKGPSQGQRLWLSRMRCCAIRRTAILHVMLILVPMARCQDDVVHLRRSEEFMPCFHERDPGEHDGYMLTCDEKASGKFHNGLPMIESDGIPITSIRIMGHAGIRTCLTGMFNGIDEQSGTGMPELHRLKIVGTSLSDFRLGCFRGLSGLRELEIQNANEFVHLEKTGLFRELRYLVSLEELILINVNLFGEIPDGAFGQWAEKLRLIHLDNNQLQGIADQAFTMNRPSLRVLKLEQQSGGWRLLRNSQRWARRLTELRTVSFTGTPLQPAPALVTVDFGRSVNSKLETLVMDECALTKLSRPISDTNESVIPTGLNLAWTLALELFTLHVNRNQFYLAGSNDSALDGLSVMRNLRVLQLEHNRIPLHSIPRWMGATTGLAKMSELRIRDNGIEYVGPNAFPPSLEILHIGANPLRYVDASWAANLAGLRELHMNHMRLDSVIIDGRQAEWTEALRPLATTLELINLMGCQLQPQMFDPNVAYITTKSDGQVVAPMLDLNMFKNLRRLLLQNNNLTHLPSNMINQLVELRHLSLAGNQLRSVETVGTSGGYQSHDPRSRLQRLDLRYNQLTTLSRCTVALGFDAFLDDLLPKRPIWLAGETEDGDSYGEKFGHVGERTTQWFGGLGLTGNQMVCDCRLAWLRRYINQMELDIARSQQQQQQQQEKTLPKGFQVYQKEALDFTCADIGRWKQRQFLSLRPEDLYAEDHAECREKPDIYGKGTSPQAELPPCTHLMPTVSNVDGYILESSMLESPYQRILPMGRNKSTKAREPSESTSLTTAAFVLLIIAGVVSLVFMIISVVIIAWMCVRFRRRKRERRMSLQRPVEERRPFTWFNAFHKPTATAKSTASIHHSTEGDIGRIFLEPRSVYEDPEHSLLRASTEPGNGSIVGSTTSAQRLTSLGERKGGHDMEAWARDAEVRVSKQPQSTALPLRMFPSTEIRDRESPCITDQLSDKAIPMEPNTSQRETRSSSVTYTGRTIQSDYQRVLPWRSRKPAGYRSFPGVLRKRLIKSVSTTTVPASVKKKESFGAYLNCFQRSNRNTNLVQSNRKQSLIDDLQADAKRKMQGPDLPKPQFVLSPILDEETGEINPDRTDYLPMSDETDQHDPHLHDLSGQTTKPDEYVNPTKQEPVLDLTGGRSGVQLRRKASKSTSELRELVEKFEHRNPLRLSDNLYALSMYDEWHKVDEYRGLPLPPPPPPPPPPPSDVYVAPRRPVKPKLAQIPVQSGPRTPIPLPPLASHKVGGNSANALEDPNNH